MLFCLGQTHLVLKFKRRKFSLPTLNEHLFFAGSPGHAVYGVGVENQQQPPQLLQQNPFYDSPCNYS
jgi:hypothetical protein